jgi:CPA2 family monovalent cation:H+ antiporter-2
MTDNVIYDLLVILAAGLVAAVVCRRLRFPVLIGYILAGVLISAGGLGVTEGRSEQISQLAEAGVFLLLFAIGLEFSLDELLALGRHLFIGGSVQMALVAGPVAAALWALDTDWQTALLLAAAVAFSSTVLVFKTLAEWGRTSTPAGRRAIGILLFQDVALVPLLLVVPMLTGGNAPGTADFIMLAATSLLFVVSVVVLRRLLALWLIPHLVSHRSPELVVLGAVVVLGGVTFAAYRIGLPPAVGAFAAGLMLSGNRWTAQFDALVMPFRETFAVVFFVSLGLLLDPQILLTEPLNLLGLLLAVLAIKALAAVIALRLTRLPWRASLATGIGLAHIGEFAFVLVAAALQAELLSSETAARFVAVALVSLMLSPLLLRFGLKQTAQIVTADDDHHRRRGHVTISPSYSLVIGVGPLGGRVAAHLETTGHEVCVIDRSPLNLQPFEQQGFRAVAGDAADEATLQRGQVRQASLAIVCVPDDSASLDVVRLIHRHNPECQIIVRCRYQSNESPLRKAGASHIISEELQAGEALIRLLKDTEAEDASG